MRLVKLILLCLLSFSASATAFANTYNLTEEELRYQFELFADYPYETSDTYAGQQWYLDYLDIAKVRECGLTGKGVRVAVIDSGVANHKDLNTIEEGYNCIYDDTSTSYLDRYYHGTMVAGIIGAVSDNELCLSGIAPDVQIIPIKITDAVGIDAGSIIDGIEKAIELDVDIINMSFGGALDDESSLKIALQDLMAQAEAKGIICVGAAGNNGGKTIQYPAGFDTVIGVGNIDSNGKVASSSQHNSSVFLTAPGTNIVSLGVYKDTKTDSGTSFSAPMVCAAAALVKQAKPNLSPAEFRSILQATVNDAGDEGYDEYYGYGILDLGNIVDYINEDIPKFIKTYGKKNGIDRIHIHNNGLSKNINAYLGNYQNDRFNSVTIKNALSTGVTNINTPENTRLFVWDDNMTPIE